LSPERSQNKNQVIKRLNIPLGLAITSISIVTSTLSIVYPWSHYDGIIVHPISDVNLCMLIIASILLIPVAFYLYLKRMSFAFVIIASLVVDVLCSFYAMSGFNIKVDLGYYLSLISSAIKSAGLSLVFLNIGIIELEIEIVKNSEEEES